MSLVVHGHPLSSFCWKVLIALYENGTPFEFRQLNNLGDPVERAAYAALWPIAKMPLLVDEGRGETVPETSIIIEYLDLHHPGPTRFIPADPDAARETRFWDRVCDLYLEVPMQRIVFDRLRGEGQHEPLTVAESRALLATALAYVEQRMAGREWLAGESFGLADCAAAPGLFYADKVMPFGADFPECALYLERLKARPSFARVLAEAEPWFQYFPERVSAFSQRVAALTGVAEEELSRLAGGDLSEVLLVPRAGEPPVVAKGGPSIATEAAMLRALAGAGVPAPAVEAEHESVLLIAYVEHDELFSPHAWADIGAALRRLHGRTGEAYGWPVDYALGTVALDNRERSDWPGFWGEQRLIAAARLLDRPWRERVERLAHRLGDLLPAAPPATFLHGDLWSGNILVRGGRLAALIDPACYHGDAEVDLAMLRLFGAPPEEFWEAYGALEPGAEARLAIYQLFPALVHMRLFGAAYAPMVDRLLGASL